MLVYIGEDIVNTECIVMVKKLSPPFYSRFDNKKLLTHVIELKPEYHTDFVRNMFVAESDLEDLHRVMMAERGEKEEEEVPPASPVKTTPQPPTRRYRRRK